MMKRWTGYMASSTISFGDVVLVPIPWADKEAGYKIRPAVVISRESLHSVGQIIVLGISSKEVRGQHEYPITRWKEAGLMFPSKVWLARPYGISVQYVRKIGKLDPAELLEIYRRFLGFV